MSYHVIFEYSLVTNWIETRFLCENVLFHCHLKARYIALDMKLYMHCPEELVVCSTETPFGFPRCFETRKQNKQLAYPVHTLFNIQIGRCRDSVATL